MKKYLLLVPALALSAQLSHAVGIKTSIGCGDGQFLISAELSGEGICLVEQTLVVNGIESVEEYSFEGSVERAIALNEGDEADVRARIQCTASNGSAGGGASASTANGCASLPSEPTPVPTPTAVPTATPEPTPTPEPTSTPEPEVSPLQDSLDTLLNRVERQFESLEARVARIEARSPARAEEYRQSALARMSRSINRQLDGIVRRYQDKVSAVELDAAVVAFKESYALVTESEL